jgi:hypothetical protein
MKKKYRVTAHSLSNSSPHEDSIVKALLHCSLFSTLIVILGLTDNSAMNTIIIWVFTRTSSSLHYPLSDTSKGASITAGARACGIPMVISWFIHYIGGW